MPTPDSSSQGLANTPFSQLNDAEAVMGGAFGDLSTSNGWIPGNSFAMPGDFGMDVDQQSTQLGNWLYMNNQMIRALEDSYF